MDHRIDNFIALAGNQHKYQYTLLLITFMIWMNVEFLSIILPFIERQPEVVFKNPETDETVENVKLNYTICNYSTAAYNITKRFEYSLVSHYNIECDKFYTGLIGSSLYTGIMLGALSFQFLADKLGRKNSANLSVVGFSINLLIASFLDNLIYTYVFFFIGGFFVNITVLSTYILVSESVASTKRAIFGSIINTAFSVCAVLYILLFKYIENLQIIYFISISIAASSIIVFYFTALESPRFYILKKDSENFIIVLKKISQINKKEDIFNTACEKDSIEYKLIVDYLKIQQTVVDNKNPNDSEINHCSACLNYTDDMAMNLLKNVNKKNISKSYLDLIKYPSLRYKFLILCFLWFCCSGNYYGMAINLKNLPGDIYQSGIYMYIFEATSYIFAGFIVDVKWIGRKKSFFIFYFIATCVFLTLTVIPLTDNCKIYLTLLARFAVAGAGYISYTYTLEVYPSSVRAQGIGINSCIAKIAGIVIPILIEFYDEDIINMIFTVINSLSFLFIMFMPETLEKPLLENIEENNN